MNIYTVCIALALCSVVMVCFHQSDAGFVALLAFILCLKGNQK